MRGTHAVQHVAGTACIDAEGHAGLQACVCCSCRCKQVAGMGGEGCRQHMLGAWPVHAPVSTYVGVAAAKVGVEDCNL